MRVCRAAPEEVMRQAECLINRQRYVSSFPRSRSGIQCRRHRFSEMREEQPAVEVLRYLQTDVAGHTPPYELIIRIYVDLPATERIIQIRHVQSDMDPFG